WWAGIRGEHGPPMTSAGVLGAAPVDERGFTHAGDPGDPAPHGTARVRQKLHEQVLRQFAVVGALRFDQQDGAGQDATVTVEHAFGVRGDVENACHGYASRAASWSR